MTHSLVSLSLPFSVRLSVSFVYAWHEFMGESASGLTAFHFLLSRALAVSRFLFYTLCVGSPASLTASKNKMQPDIRADEKYGMKQEQEKSEVVCAMEICLTSFQVKSEKNNPTR